MLTPFKKVRTYNRIGNDSVLEIYEEEFFSLYFPKVGRNAQLRLVFFLILELVDFLENSIAL